MKKLNLSIIYIFLLLLLVMNFSCDIFGPSDPVAKTKSDAWETIINAHSAKQQFYVEYFRIHSNNYKRGKLFVYEPKQDEIDYLWNMFYHVLNYSDEVDAAVDTLIAMANEDGMPLAKGSVSSSVFGALADFFGVGKGVFVKNRKRILLIASNMTKTDRDQLYNELVIDTWQSEIGTADEFWAKLQNGDLDDKASTLYKNFYDRSNVLLNPFTYYADQSNLTPGKTMSKDGMELCNKGLDVVIETAGTIIPGLSKAKDLYDDGKDLLEKSKKMVDKPLDAIADEIKSRAIGKVSGMVDVDNYFDPEGAGKYVKILAEVSLGTDDPDELVEKGIDYGIAKLTSSDKSIKPDYAIAKNKQPSVGIPEFIIAVGNMGRNANEFIMNLPSGNWDITAKDRDGQSSGTESTPVTSQQETTVDVVKLDSTKTDDEPPENELALGDVLDSLDIKIDSLYTIDIWFNDGSGGNGNETFHLSNYVWRSTNKDIYVLKWTGTNFFCEFEYYLINDWNDSTVTEITIDGNFALDSLKRLVLFIDAEETTIQYKIDTLGAHIVSQFEDVYSINNLLYESQSPIEVNYYFSIFNADLSVSEYIDHSSDYIRYDRYNFTIVEEEHYNGWIGPWSGRVSARLRSYPDNISTSWNLIFDY
ncbi:MAG: hypothetical protein WCT23_00805 [Candidatus Neomarinimicrobiota bacterium]